jgi:menaquinol-cytochrome c reductase cytochrome b subunit
MPKIKPPLPPVPDQLKGQPRHPGSRPAPEGVVDGAIEVGTSAANWIDERLQLSGGLRWALFRKVPRHDWTYSLGSSVMFAFLSQAVTGVFLATSYDPSTTNAYESVRYITNEMFLGQFVRGMHKWGSTVMVVLLFVHMAQTFFYGAYKYPRELNWVLGVALLALTMAMSFTGYLLPFDQRSYWATIVGVNINGTGPLAGPYLSDFLTGGPDIGATTLSRFYAIHMMLIPGAIGALIGAHLWLVTKLGTTSPPWNKPRRKS